MKEKGVVGAFGSGGIHSYFVKMLQEGLFRALFDVQCFDLDAIRSAAEDPRHMAMSASLYGNPHTKGCIVNNLDVMILGATEIDTDFNVNVITGSDGVILAPPAAITTARRAPSSPSSSPISSRAACAWSGTG